MKKQHWFFLLLIVAMSSLAIGQTGTNQNDCVTPQSAAVYAISTNSATLSWVPAMSTNAWEVELGFADFVPGAREAIMSFELSSNTITISSRLTKRIVGLAALQTYDVYIRTVCPDNGTSEWKGPLTFQTQKGITISN